MSARRAHCCSKMSSEPVSIDVGERGLRSTVPINRIAANAVVGVVVIGRNEGERLQRCLESLAALNRVVVYVDSGSTDGSVNLAIASGAAVLALDLGRPFTAARARNAGFAELTSLAGDGLRYVQFVDGDCEVMPSWLETASTFLDQHNDVACVCGRLRERYPERSVYNLLCDMEWDRPVGATKACGGIAMLRCDVFAALGGFREDLVAGEEPELCVRIRARGAKVWRLAQHMAWHDAAMLHFNQWWKRSRRGGFGAAQAAFMQGSARERGVIRQMLRPWFWAGIVPFGVTVACVVLGLPALTLLLAYPVQMLRIASGVNGSWGARLPRAFFMLFGKFPELLGQLQFWLSRKPGRAAPSFDYKG